MNEIINSLIQSPIFKVIPERELKVIVEHSSIRHLKAGEILFDDGDSGGSLFLILEGEIEISKKNISIARRKPFELIGEMSLLGSKSRTANARALSSTKLLEITRDLFRTYIASNVEAVLGIMEILSDRSGSDLEVLDAGYRDLRRTEEYYQGIVDSVTDIILRISPEGKIDYVNSSIGVLGYEPGSLLGKDLDELIDVKNITPIHQLLTRRVYSRATQNLEVWFRINEYSNLETKYRKMLYLVNASGVWDVPNKLVKAKSQDKKFLGTQIVAREITKRKVGEESISHLKLQLESMLEVKSFFGNKIENTPEEKAQESVLHKILFSASDSIFLIDNEGKIELINPSLEKLFGYEYSELKAKDVEILFLRSSLPLGQTGLDILNKHDSLNAVDSFLELEGVKKDGSVFPIELVFNQFNFGVKRKVVGFIRDISERKQAEAKILTARIDAEKANKAKSIFLANMSHEIRTPMNAILGYAQVLLRKQDLNIDTKKAIQTIESSGKNLLNLINEILDISKIESGRMELNNNDFEICHFISEIENLLRSRCVEKGLNLIVKAPTEPIWVRGDENKLRQVVINLLGNAIKFTESGDVSLLVDILENESFRFNVVDTGPGISLKHQQIIFSPFDQGELGTDKGGTGLGLAISKKIVELMRAELKIESGIGKGSRFYFTLQLPEGKEKVGATKVANLKAIGLRPGCEVLALIVDDIKENRDVISLLLKDIGIKVCEAENGKKAIELAKKLQPDIIFMDMRMPVMNGEEAVKNLQKEFGVDRFKVVAVTASVLDYKPDYFLGLGFHAFISKPFEEDELFNCLSKVLDVDFVYENKEAEENSIDLLEFDFSKFSLSETLHEQLDEAANVYSITEVERVIKELAQMDTASKELSKLLERMLRNYNMDQISQALKKIKKENKN